MWCVSICIKLGLHSVRWNKTKIYRRFQKLRTAAIRPDLLTYCCKIAHNPAQVPGRAHHVICNPAVNWIQSQVWLWLWLWPPVSSCSRCHLHSLQWWPELVCNTDYTCLYKLCGTWFNSNVAWFVTSAGNWNISDISNMWLFPWVMGRISQIMRDAWYHLG